MIEEVTTIMQILADTIKVSGELALFGLAGYGVFKLLTLASYLYFGKYCVTRLFNWLSDIAKREKTIITRYQLGSEVIDAYQSAFYQAIMMVRTRKGYSSAFGYLQRDDIEWIRNALLVKLKEEGQDNTSE